MSEAKKEGGCKRWYTLQVTSGFEFRVQKSLQELAARYDAASYFGGILVPTETIVELKNGKRTQTKKKFFPGYILIQMQMHEDAWVLVKKVPYVLGFVGGTFPNPIPISDEEVSALFSRLEETEKNPRQRFTFEPGEEVRVLEGPFADFIGTVERVDYGKNRLYILVSILGQLTPIELKFQQVSRDL